MKKPCAVFLDRDGVINELVYDSEWDMSESPRTTTDFRLLPRVGEAVKKLNRAGLEVILVSNQPDMAKGRISERRFQEIRRHMLRLLGKKGARLDAEYYCFHHPQAVIRKYRVNCDCRKPKPGLIKRAAAERGISLRNSYMVGDRPADIIAGRAAGCRTIWLSDMKCEYCTIMHRMKVQPDLIFRDLSKASTYLVQNQRS
jgi:D-glycero-D-manno-heptose 1,7-bisphosphate phosphatase